MSNSAKAKKKRSYSSENRSRAAEATRGAILAAARSLFARRGIDQVTIAEIAERARVAVPTVYAGFQSKEGILRALVRDALFGEQFEIARRHLEGVTDPVEMIAITPEIAGSVWDAESDQLGLLRGASAFSPSLRKLEEEFEQMRLEMQESRIRLLFEQNKARPGLTLGEARRILWMYTSRDVYRMLVIDGGWTRQHYRRWLRETLIKTLVKDEALGR